MGQLATADICYYYVRNYTVGIICLTKAEIVSTFSETVRFVYETETSFANLLGLA